jgi:hypothetical protein
MLKGELKQLNSMSTPMWYLLVLFTIVSDIDKYMRNAKDWE